MFKVPILKCKQFRKYGAWHASLLFWQCWKGRLCRICQFDGKLHHFASPCYTYSCLFVQSGDKCNSIAAFELSWLKKGVLLRILLFQYGTFEKTFFTWVAQLMVNIWPLEQCETHYPPTFHLPMIMVKFSNVTLPHSLNWIAQNLASNSLSSHLEHVLV